MKKIIFVGMCLAIFAVACKKNFDEGGEKSFNSPTAVLDTLKGVIAANRTVSTNAYLYGIVYVRPGVTLTIQPGVTVFGSQSTVVGTVNTVGGLGVFDTVNLERNEGTLCIQSGTGALPSAILNAAGTAGNPIVWTSDNKISVGSRKVGDWGGIILYGNATFHQAAAGATVNNTIRTRFEAFDGVPGRTENYYGGTNDGDNSGTMTYNRLEFGGGIVTAVGKEVNGLTLCAVGSGTTIKYVEVVKSGDDGFEWFGGAVNCDHLLSYANKDDDFDMDEGYHGNLQFIVALRDTSADNSGSHMIEIDNDASVTPTNGNNFQPYTAPIISNATLIGPSARNDLGPGANGHGSNPNYFESAIQSRRRASLRLINSYIIPEAMPYGVIFTPTTGCGAGVGPVAVLLDPPSVTTPGNVQAYNMYSSTTVNAGYGSYLVQSPVEGNGTGIYPGSVFLPNDAVCLGKLTSAANSNGAFNGLSDLGPGLGNTSSTPGYNTGLVLGAPFTATSEKGGVLSTDDWLLNNFGTGKLISITVQ